MNPCLDKQELNFKEKNLWAVVKHLEKRVERVPGGGSIKDAINNPVKRIEKPWNKLSKSEKRQIVVQWLKERYEDELKGGNAIGTRKIKTNPETGYTEVTTSYFKDTKAQTLITQRAGVGITEETDTKWTDDNKVITYKSFEDWIGKNPKIVDKYVAITDEGFTTGHIQNGYRI